MEYQVDLEVFHGPLDLLLYLVKRDEIDLRDIPIARVAEQFKQYLDVLTLYYKATCPYSLRVRLILTEKLLPFSRRVISGEDSPAAIQITDRSY